MPSPNAKRPGRHSASWPAGGGKAFRTAASASAKAAADRRTPRTRSRVTSAASIVCCCQSSERGRRPIAEPLRVILLAGFMRAGRPAREALVSPVSVMSGKLAARATAAWAEAGLKRMTLHECRHTYASFLMAAGYTLKELMEFMGHSSLQAAERYIKLLPRPDETDPAERLNAYLRRRATGD